MIILSILAVLLISVILLQNPKGNSKVLAVKIGAKQNKSTLSFATWGLATGIVLLALVLH